jgi:ABC-type antimicrobial peptide transport system permease subunit
VKPLRLRDTALAALLRCLLQLRCCTPLPLCNTLFQRLALLSDTSLVQSAIRQSLLAPFSTASKRVTIIAFFPTLRCTRIIRLAAERICRIDYTRCAVRRGINSIPPMTAAAALLSSFVRAVLTWRHRTVTSNCEQSDDTSSAVSSLIA